MNVLNKLYNDHRLILIAAIVAITLSYAVLHLPKMIMNIAFWEFCFTVIGISLIVLIAKFYYYSQKVVKK